MQRKGCRVFDTMTKEKVWESGTQVINALYSEQELNKDSQVSVRIDRGLYQALEAQTEVWHFKNVSQTVRAILTFYFLPVAYEYELKNKSVSDFKNFIEEKRREGFSIEQTRANYFVYQVAEYMQFLEQARVMGKHSIDFMDKTSTKLNKIMAEVEGKLEQAINEIEQEQRGADAIEQN